ncbi:hypothetical protein D9757_010158 [Collybiopsis confluens]|uniref:Integral membrane bound transporter domain-containing protein n=1 Tax=Collybiopsis confluens TaxID=2823264 RepID=A0A8H5H076_9AGAR|nr:hypothetical protein D9757_010158 [Collybiopsis confluens]
MSDPNDTINSNSSWIPFIPGHSLDSSISADDDTGTSSTRPVPPNLSTSLIGSPGLGDARRRQSHSLSPNKLRPSLGRSATTPHLYSSARKRNATLSRLNTSATSSQTPVTPAREWSVFGQLMEDEGQLTSATSLSRRYRRRNSSQDNAPAESLIDSFASFGAGVQSPVAEHEGFFASGPGGRITPADSDDDSGLDDASGFDSDDSLGSSSSSTIEGEQNQPQPRWYHRIRQKLPTVSVLHRNIFKCAVAYFIASLFTFNPYLAGFMSDLVNYGTGTHKPLPSGHMVATVAVYFNPAKSMGGMIEADFFCLFGILYSAFICLSSMTVFWWLDVQPGWEWLADALAVVWVGVGMSFLAWMKVYMANPQFNTACSMMAIVIFVVLVKEGGLHQLLQVTFIVSCGALTSNIVCYLIWPQSATDTLRSNMIKTIDSFGTLLGLLTETFLLEEPVHHRSQGRIQRAVEAHQSSFVGLKKNLKEAGVEWRFSGWGGGGSTSTSTSGRSALGSGSGPRTRTRTTRGGVGKYTDAETEADSDGGVSERVRSRVKRREKVGYSGVGGGRRKAYADAVDSLNRLAQHLNGLRSGTRLQFELAKAGAVAQARKRKTKKNDDIGKRMNNQGKDTLVDVSVTSSVVLEEDEEDAAMLNAAAIMFGDLVDDLGPPMKALSNTCTNGLKRLRESFSHSNSGSGSRRRQAFDPSEFYTLIDSIEAALMRFESTSNHAVMRLYRKSDLVRAVNAHTQDHDGNDITRASNAATANLEVPDILQSRSQVRPSTSRESLPPPVTPASVRSARAGTAGNRDRSGTVRSMAKSDKDFNVFLGGERDGAEHEFAREMTGLVDAMERIYALEEQNSTWRRWSAKVIDAVKGTWRESRRMTMSSSGGEGGVNGDSKKGRRSPLTKRLSRIIHPRPTRSHRPQFPKVTPHAPDTIQTPSPRNLSFIGRVGQGIWALGKRLNERDTKYAVKAGMATAILAAPAFFDVTREVFIEYYGDWALISFFVVMSPTIGATNFLGLHRILGTLFGAAVAAGIFSLFSENATVLAIFGFFFSIPCFYYLVGKPAYASSARFVLLTYNLTCLYCYNLREKDLSVARIAYHRAISVTAGVVWAGLVSRFWWPAEARRELSKALGEFCLNVGWLYTRLVQSNSFTPEYSGLEDDEDEDDEEEGQGDRSRRSSASGSGSSLDRPRVNGSIKEFMAMELHLQIKLIELQGLLSQAQHEPRLKGPFPVGLYRGILTSLQAILDKLHSMRLKAPLPPYLPPAEESRVELVNAIRNLNIVRKRDVKVSKQLLFFAYAMAMRGVTNELEVLGGILQDAFGVIGKSREEFERLFVDEPWESESEFRDAEAEGHRV